MEPFETIVPAYYPAVYQFLLRLCGNRETAQDLARMFFCRPISPSEPSREPVS